MSKDDHFPIVDFVWLAFLKASGFCWRTLYIVNDGQFFGHYIDQGIIISWNEIHQYLLKFPFSWLS